MVKNADETSREQIERLTPEAEILLNDEDKLERFLQRLEKKLKAVPVAGDKLAMVPIMISLIKSFVKKEYTDVPIGTILSILAALIYFVSPIDLIPDNIPVVGYLDDMAVIGFCLKMVGSDLEEYDEWRKKNGHIIEL